MIFNPSVTSCHLPYILLGKTPRKATGYGREEGKYPQSIGADKSCSRGYFQHSPSAHRRGDRGSARRARGLNLQNITCYFPTPLFVAIAPLSLPYILRCKTQGRSINAFNNRNRVVYLPLTVLRSITGHSRGGGWKSFDNIVLLLF